MMIESRQGIKPLVIKFGFALALSFAGLLYSRMRTKRIKRPPLLPPPPSPGKNKQFDSQGRARIKDESHGSQRMPVCPEASSMTADGFEQAGIRVKADTANEASSIRERGDQDGFLLPEFNDLVNEFDMAASVPMSSQKIDAEALKFSEETPRSSNGVYRSEYEQEICNLKTMVGLLKERERYLEIQLLKYYGLKEQETAVMELQNQLQIRGMEAKLFSMKIESLQADNNRLEAQLADHSKVMADLEAAKAKVKVLKRKLRSDAEQNKEQILNLKERVMRLQEQELDRDADVRLKLQRQAELQAEFEELKQSNLNLQLENSELADRLESMQLIATSMLEDTETENLRKESAELRQEKENLAKEVERLQADRCTDAEELVYLRWVNACLRHELRNYKPPPGKTIARDLSKSLSPRSEEKAKQLILEYASSQGAGETGSSVIDFDSDQWSSSQSYLTDSPDSTSDRSAAQKLQVSSKTKFFWKLRRLIRGREDTRRSPVPRSRSVDDFARRRSCDYPRSSSSIEMANEAPSPKNVSPAQNLDRQQSLELGKLAILTEEENEEMRTLRRSTDSGPSCSFKRFVLGRESASSSPKGHQTDKDSDGSQKSDLAKYADALRDSPWSGHSRRRAVTFSHG